MITLLTVFASTELTEGAMKFSIATLVTPVTAEVESQSDQFAAHLSGREKAAAVASGLIGAGAIIGLKKAFGNKEPFLNVISPQNDREYGIGNSIHIIATSNQVKWHSASQLTTQVKCPESQFEQVIQKGSMKKLFGYRFKVGFGNTDWKYEHQFKVTSEIGIQDNMSIFSGLW
eukprot:NODE_577_length_5827_cov_0.545740.p4 type:complete len:174 gc:universal NODE_577_length_5827_cov_0.545740:4574-4053(-)